MSKSMVLIGASAGGPDSIIKILSSIKRKLNFPVVVALHNMSSQVEGFAELLKRVSNHEVVIINNKPIKNAIYLAKGGKDVVLVSKEVISSVDPESHVSPSINRLFLSVEKIKDIDFHIFLLGGLGNDGVKGLIKLEDQENVHIYLQSDAKFPYIPMSAMKDLKRYKMLTLSEIIEIINDLNSK